MKITIIGSSGAGKSTLARKISRECNIPQIEIDRIWFKYDGHKYINSPRAEEKEVISKKIEEDIQEFLRKNQNWVIDGTYSKIQPIIAEQADEVVLIQRPLLHRIGNHIVRVCRGRDRHPEVTKIQDLWFVKTIFKRWRNDENLKLHELSKRYAQKLAVLRSFKEINMYYKKLTELTYY